MLGAFAMPSAGQNRTVRDRQGQSRTTAVNGRNGANGDRRSEEGYCKGQYAGRDYR